MVSLSVGDLGARAWSVESFSLGSVEEFVDGGRSVAVVDMVALDEQQVALLDGGEEARPEVNPERDIWTPPPNSTKITRNCTLRE